MNKRSALGKGLSALLSDTEPAREALLNTSGSGPEPTAGSVSMIALHQIEANPFQPRSEFEERALNDLAESIRSQGIIQPITLRRMSPGKYQIISGERRFRASKLAGLTEVPAYIRLANDQAMLEMALVENIQRENLNAIEIAISYQRLIEECSLTQEALAERVGKERSTVTNYLRLLRLPPQIQFAIRDGKLSMGHARAILGVEDIGMQLRVFNDILNQDLSVRSTEDLVRSHGPRKGESSRKEKSGPHAAEIAAVRERIARRYETKVEIRHKSGGNGQVVLNYYSLDDLNRLIDLLDYD